eukprot:2336431-Amphidinium_carterae.1
MRIAQTLQIGSYCKDVSNQSSLKKLNTTAATTTLSLQPLEYSLYVVRWNWAYSRFSLTGKWWTRTAPRSNLQAPLLVLPTARMVPLTHGCAIATKTSPFSFILESSPLRSLSQRTVALHESACKTGSSGLLSTPAQMTIAIKV